MKALSSVILSTGSQFKLKNLDKNSRESLIMDRESIREHAKIKFEVLFIIKLIFIIIAEYFCKYFLFPSYEN